MEIRFIKSARKHRIGKSHALYVIERYEPIRDFGRDDFETKLYWQVFDDRGVELEIVGVELGSQIVVIHVMPMIYWRRDKREN